MNADSVSTSVIPASLDTPDSGTADTGSPATISPPSAGTAGGGAPTATSASASSKDATAGFAESSALVERRSSGEFVATVVTGLWGRVTTFGLLSRGSVGNGTRRLRTSSSPDVSP